ncbi:hypothetical protein [Herbaspirillum aquaticum]|uniref:hypothetical protein n=1 Tax=Herbaspirillum aquaticum TaxID=568783 RepID=UPI0024DED95D|nr:hypothetical protein [Herbaspirillum aquaticum]
MRSPECSRVIYGDAPFIEDMGLLTVLCLLNDEVILCGSVELEDQLNKYWEIHPAECNDGNSIISQTLTTLLPEGVVSFLSPADSSIRFPGSENIELGGIEGLETVDVDGKEAVYLKINEKELTDITRILLRGLGGRKRTVSSLIRDASVLSVAVRGQIPIVCKQSKISVSTSEKRVSAVSSFLAQRAFERLALPELQAYHVDDILEARLKLSGELRDFRSGIRELVWLLHERIDISGDLKGLAKECDLLIDTKIWAAVSNLENAIAKHENKRIRRILKTTGNTLLEVGKTFLAPSLAGQLLGGGSALMKAAEGLDVSPPTVQIASFIYKAREKKF